MLVKGGIAVHNCIHCLPCVQVTSGWLVALSLQKGGWSCSMKESGGEWLLGVTAVSLELSVVLQQLMLHVDRQGTPTLKALDPLNGRVAQFG